jgi:adenosylcobinamide-phosphate synthase
LAGGLLGALERPLRALKRCRRAAGALFLLAALLLCGAATLLFMNLPELFRPALSSVSPGRFAQVFGVLCALYLAYSGLALGCLLREGRKAVRAIGTAEAAARAEKENAGALLREARLTVAMLVSREVSGLDAAALYRTLAESLSENFNDAFVAPFFWLVLGGPAGLWLYKCASTADSRWGYKHEPWTRAGWAAARLDDVLAFAPARLSAVFLYLGSGPAGWKIWPGWGPFRRQARRMESPNAGWSMAAAAWLHRAAMGGPAVYAGKVKDKPRLGPERGADAVWDGAKIAALLRHLLLAGLIGALVLSAPFALAGLTAWP